MLRHSTVSSTSRLEPLLSPAAAAESATDARSEKKICTWCGRGRVRYHALLLLVLALVLVYVDYWCCCDYWCYY